jgi:polar amino acid transport system substrate-binding protein
VNLYANPHITVVSTYKWEPFNIKVKGRLQGIGIDFWKLVAKKAGIDYTFKTVETWSDVLKMIKEGKAALTISTDATENRKSYAVFSKPYVVYPLVIATKNDVGFIFDTKFLRNKTIAIGSDYTASEIMKKNFPDLKYIYTNSIDSALMMVKNNEAFCAIDILPVVAYKINKYQYGGLKISGRIPVIFKVRIMLSGKYKYLLPKINKAIDSITYKEKQEIYNKYVKPEKKYVFSSDELFLYILIGLSLSVVLMLWIYTLKAELLDIKQKENLRHSKDTDKLTGLFNKEKIKKIIENKINGGECFSLIMFDIKGFRNINRFYGHHFGDIILLELVSAFRSFLEKDDIFARMGGGSFLIITNKTEIDACHKAKNILRSLNEFEFNTAKEIVCDFALKSVCGENSVDEILNELEKELIKNKKNGVFKC